MTQRAFVDQFTIFLLSYAYQILMCLGSLSWNHFQRDDQAEGLTIAAQESEALFFFLMRCITRGRLLFDVASMSMQSIR